MKTDSIKKSVVDAYGNLAQLTEKNIFSKLFSCCSPQSKTYEIGEKIGYSKNQLDAIPEGSNLGVGCGNPSAFTNIQSGETVVDLGSGAGFDAFIVSPLVKDTGKVIGIDLSDQMLELAKTNAQKGNYTNVQFLKGDIEAIPLNNEVADHVISNCVINLSLNKKAVFEEAYRILKPGGKLAISDVILEKKLPSFITKLLAGHIACISGAEKLDDYLGYIKSAGFKNIQIEKKSDFPIELMMTDPQLMKISKNLNIGLDSKKAKELASRVSSISLTAQK